MKPSFYAKHVVSTNRKSSQIAMKYLLLFICVLVFTQPQTVFGQIYKLKTTAWSSKQKLDNGDWTTWSKWEDVSNLITINSEKERITIYSSKTQVYDIAKDEGKETDKDGDDTYSFYCLNEDGLTCRIRLVILNSANKKKQLYVDFGNMKYVYNIYALE